MQRKYIELPKLAPEANNNSGTHTPVQQPLQTRGCQESSNYALLTWLVTCAEATVWYCETLYGVFVSI